MEWSGAEWSEVEWSEVEWSEVECGRVEWRRVAWSRGQGRAKESSVEERRKAEQSRAKTKKVKAEKQMTNTRERCFGECLCRDHDYGPLLASVDQDSQSSQLSSRACDKTCGSSLGANTSRIALP